MCDQVTKGLGPVRERTLASRRSDGHSLGNVEHEFDPKTHKHSVATANALRTYLPYPCPVPSVYVTVTYISMLDVKCRFPVLPHYPPSAMRSCGRPTHASAAFECARSIQTATSWQIEYDLAVLLKHLSPEDLSEKISGISLTRHVIHLNSTSST